MRRTNAGHIVRVIIGAILSILGVLALALLAVMIYASVTKTVIDVGLGSADAAIGPVEYDTTEQQMHFGQPPINNRVPTANSPNCDSVNYQELPAGPVGFYLNTCFHWSSQPYPTPIATQLQPIPVPTGVPTVLAPVSTLVP